MMRPYSPQRWRSGALAIACALSVTAGCTQVNPEVKETRKDAAMKQPLTHPGKIRFWTMFDKSFKDQAITDIPLDKQWVYFDKLGQETSDITKAASAVPVLEVKMFSFDAKGDLVAPDVASSLLILEFGPEERQLRSLRMQKN